MPGILEVIGYSLIFVALDQVDFGEGALADNFHDIPVLEVDFALELVADVLVGSITTLVLDKFDEAHTLGVRDIAHPTKD